MRLQRMKLHHTKNAERVVILRLGDALKLSQCDPDSIMQLEALLERAGAIKKDVPKKD